MTSRLASPNHVSSQDDEYAIYDTCQQRMRYLVEFTLPGDEVKDIVSQSDELTSDSQDLPADVGDIGKWKTRFQHDSYACL